ncbi:hypothetical protein OUZ56_026505 [Daphnia magna]|uniref:Uncharacterized protein n=1 Tax=Daphnia magna TaxID=35525 RepID=A0ABQ9ZLY4_9CRUS|nr:hypothetical protein OUZ56_026505 [Daphnia magna]
MFGHDSDIRRQKCAIWDSHILSSFATLPPWLNEMLVTITNSESEKKRSPIDWNITPWYDSFTSSAPSMGVGLIAARVSTPMQIVFCVCVVGIVGSGRSPHG